MQRIAPVVESGLPSETTQMLEAVKAQMGMVPNIIKVMANSPVALSAYLGLTGALGQGVLSPQLREQIALTVAGINKCDYCASVHTAVGKQVGLDAQELAQNLTGASSDSKTHTALSLVRQIVEHRGNVPDTYLVLAHTNGFSDEQILEIFSHTMLNMFTNYFNHLVRTEIDFPVVNTGGVTTA